MRWTTGGKRLLAGAGLIVCALALPAAAQAEVGGRADTKSGEPVGEARPAVAATVTKDLVGTVTLNAGASVTQGWNNAFTTTLYSIDVSPKFAGVDAPCVMEVTRVWSQQVVNSGNTVERELRWTIKNIGTIACSADVWLGRIS
jgi:hypothetical protein